MMNIYVLEIEQRPILAFFAESPAAADEYITSPWLRDDLAVLECDGLPVWDGQGAFTARPANSGESERFESDLQEARQDGDPIDEATWMVFLIDVTDPDDDDDDEDLDD